VVCKYFPQEVRPERVWFKHGERLRRGPWRVRGKMRAQRICGDANCVLLRLSIATRPAWAGYELSCRTAAPVGSAGINSR
jgi:hypothetical protein